MTEYCINNAPLENGVHELHEIHCRFLPATHQLQFLGAFENCYSAMVKARTVHDSANGCYYCCKEAYYSSYNDEYEERLQLMYASPGM